MAPDTIRAMIFSRSDRTAFDPMLFVVDQERKEALQWMRKPILKNVSMIRSNG